MSKIKVNDLISKFRLLIGDSSISIGDDFLIEGINWALNELPRVPKLDRLFSKHFTTTLDAKKHYKWDLNQDFRMISEIPFLNFWTSTGGEPCPLNLCNRDNTTFFTKNGLPELRKPGTPCEYTIEREGDHNYLVIDRPSDVPLIIDYIAYGFLKPVNSLEDELDISALAENLILTLLKNVYYSEAQDFNIAEGAYEYLDNKAYREATQFLYHKYGAEAPTIVGER